ncbi:hypothetical protein ACIBUR_28625 [Streptomyces anulatus]
MNRRTFRILTAGLSAAALAGLAACGSDTGSDRPAGDPTAKVAANARAYMTAWMASRPSDGKAMCELQTKAARPNFDEDGGTLDGCIKQRAQDSESGASDDTSGKLTIKISAVQDVPASDAHPAGKGALASMSRPGKDPFRYALRLVKEDDQWLVEQITDVGEQFAHTADPVAPVLAQQS